MSIHAALRHTTTYDYDRPVALGPQIVRLRPAPHCRTPILSYSLKIAPEPHFLNWQQDVYGNYLARLVFPERTRRFSVDVDLVADMATINPFDFFLEPGAEHYPFVYEPAVARDLAPFLEIEPSGPLLEAWVASVDRGGEPGLVNFLVGINQRLQGEVAYIVRMEPGVWTPDQTLAEGRGSCRDSAWVLVQVMRRLGIAARFVSGYLIQLVADQKPVEGPAGPTADFTDLHAWCEVFLPGAGWVGLDPTSGLLAGEGHIPLACTAEPSGAAPITGAVEKSEVTFGFDMAVSRIYERPRVTKPYRPEQWAAIEAMGRRVDAALKAGDVRLTMGGEPTFVSTGDMDGAEWNTAALGPTKRAMAGKLLRRLADRWTHGALLHYGQGKWYPGEQLPRWALTCVWRKDGEPVWRAQALLAGDEDSDDADAAVAADFGRSLAQRLQVDPELLLTAFEDSHYYLWRERRLPANVAVDDARLADPLERERIARVFEQGLGKPVGSVLPLRKLREGHGERWQSGPWYTRSDQLFLVPGDSPIGFRLPLESLPWMSEEVRARQTEWDADPMAPRGALPPRRALSAQPGEGPAAFQPTEQRRPALHESADDVIRTALCIEPRGGLLHVFMPPLTTAEDYLQLTAAVEDTAHEFGRKVFVEGYLPPADPRLVHFSVTPDPGVIEVNVHPVSSWEEMSRQTEELYEEARQVGLSTEKFMLDGRHVGTGGGNHVVMGGEEAAESPFLRRPDLLRSLLTFWQNHPSLSYLFSGLFIGPTSQHPRVDEARDDQLYELDIAFRRVAPNADVPPWLTDRLLRNLLIDVTGNTHRTEFCIDKLYSPDGPGGRRGLVELRAFEMPPHAQMSMAQRLLIRGLIAAFWERPYERPLVRWGTRLHDDFMLPHFVGQDFEDVLDELRSRGFGFDPGWFAPHQEFRFPRIGGIDVRGMELELRHALEPWHVLGEEGAIGGTVRYVDSAVERLQVKLRGWVDERYLVACNGVAVPMTATGRAGEYVAGVRFKAWQPPTGLHPTIAPQAPLTFDLFDRWNGRSLGGCTYHVAHPGGRNYDRFPVNANEAEARRLARFFAIGHTPGAMAEPTPRRSLEHPLTLDLRRYA